MTKTAAEMVAEAVASGRKHRPKGRLRPGRGRAGQSCSTCASLSNGSITSMARWRCLGDCSSSRPTPRGPRHNTELDPARVA